MITSARARDARPLTALGPRPSVRPVRRSASRATSWRTSDAGKRIADGSSLTAPYVAETLAAERLAMVWGVLLRNNDSQEQTPGITPENAKGESAQWAGLTPENAELFAPVRRSSRPLAADWSAGAQAGLVLGTDGCWSTRTSPRLVNDRFRDAGKLSPSSLVKRVAKPVYENNVLCCCPLPFLIQYWGGLPHRLRPRFHP